MTRRYQNLAAELDAIPLRAAIGIGAVLGGPVVIARITAGTEVALFVGIPLLTALAALLAWLTMPIPKAVTAAPPPAAEPPPPGPPLGGWVGIPVRTVGPALPQQRRPAVGGPPHPVRGQITPLRREITSGPGQLPE